MSMEYSERAADPEAALAATAPDDPMAATQAPTSASAVVVVSRFAIANGMTEEVREAFRKRPHLVDDAEGFLRMEVISPQDRPEEIWLMTWWRSEHDYQVWHRGHTYRASHSGMPRGLRLDPRSTEIRIFDHVCS